jgi:hypothetical protein
MLCEFELKKLLYSEQLNGIDTVNVEFNASISCLKHI